MIAEGDVIGGRYLIRRQLGSGTTGTTYQATDRKTDGDVTVKVIHPHLARDRAYMARLQRRARAAAALDLPDIARVIEWSGEGPVKFVVAPYVPDDTIAGVLARDGAFPVVTALEVGLRVARTLDALSRQGDRLNLKPSNICIQDGKVTLLDVGVPPVTVSLASTDAVAITAGAEYLAPEIAHGPGDVRSDIYALGMVLFEMLAGRAPFRGDAPEAVFRKQAADPAVLPPGLPAAVYVAVGRCLKKVPEHRYQKPAHLVTALDGCLRVLNAGASRKQPVPATAAKPLGRRTAPQGGRPRPAAPTRPIAPKQAGAPSVAAPVVGASNGPQPGPAPGAPAASPRPSQEPASESKREMWPAAHEPPPLAGAPPVEDLDEHPDPVMASAPASGSPAPSPAAHPAAEAAEARVPTLSEPPPDVSRPDADVPAACALLGVDETADAELVELAYRYHVERCEAAALNNGERVRRLHALDAARRLLCDPARPAPAPPAGEPQASPAGSGRRLRLPGWIRRSSAPQPPPPDPYQILHVHPSADHAMVAVVYRHLVAAAVRSDDAEMLGLLEQAYARISAADPGAAGGAR